MNLVSRVLARHVGEQRSAQMDKTARDAAPRAPLNNRRKGDRHVPKNVHLFSGSFRHLGNVGPGRSAPESQKSACETANAYESQKRHCQTSTAYEGDATRAELGKARLRDLHKPSPSVAKSRFVQ
jgi:hypothetical protein